MANNFELRQVDFRRPGSGVHACRNVSLSFPAGGVTALLGENSAGKTTLGHILAGVVPADSGVLVVPGVQAGWDLSDSSTGRGRLKDRNRPGEAAQSLAEVVHLVGGCRSWNAEPAVRHQQDPF